MTRNPNNEDVFRTHTVPARRIRARVYACLALALVYAALEHIPQAIAGEDNQAISQVVSGKQLAAKLRMEFIDLSPQIIEAAINKARFRPDIIERMLKPYEAKPYAEYRPLFVNSKLVELGKPYLMKHKAIFDRAEKKYGVQPEIIAAILGMETRYGQYRGKDRILDALYTLSTGFPRRAKFFRKELGHFLLMSGEENLTPENLKGSMAGAFGTAQFMPSSFRAYAVDGDGDGKRDIWDSPADIIFSVANYFQRHGWDGSKPVAHWLKNVPDHRLVNKAKKSGTRKWQKLAEMKLAGIGPLPDMWKNDDRVSLLTFDTKNGEKTALVHYNFYVIMRYNTAQNYAMAATELADMLGCTKCANK